MKTVLIFAHECAPFHRIQSTIGAQRPAQFAKYMPQYGWRAIVICRNAEQEGSINDIAEVNVGLLVDTSLTKAVVNESVIIATPSLKHDGGIDRLWRYAGAEARSTGKFWKIYRKLLTSVKFLTGDYSQNWQAIARVVSTEVAKRITIDCCIGEHSPDAGIHLARWFSEEYGVPWVADFRDPALLQHGRIAAIMHKPILKRQLRSANRLVNVTPRWAQLDEAEFGRPAICITNGFDLCEIPAVGGASHSRDLVITYAGNINAGNITPYQGLHIFLQGLGQVQASGRGKIIFKYFGGSHQLISELAEKYGISDYVLSKPAIDRKEVLKEMVNSDLLLLLSVSRPEKENKYYRNGFYPGKVFEYFGAGRPVISVPGDSGQLDELIRETDTGKVLGTSGEVSAYLCKLAEEKWGGNSISFSPDSEIIRQYTRQYLTGKMAACLDECIVT